MAKLTGPLLSLGASHAIGKQVVFTDWKHLHVARQYVVAPNPRSQAQTTARNLFKNAILLWHLSGFNTLDKAAWTLYAKTPASTITGYSAFLKAFLDQYVQGGTWEPMSNSGDFITLPTVFAVRITKSAIGAAPIMYYGTTTTNMPSSFTGIHIGANRWIFMASPILPNTRYYFTFKVGVVAANFGRLGIYTIKTPAA